jgi:hypothetical protein
MRRGIWLSVLVALAATAGCTTTAGLAAGPPGGAAGTPVPPRLTFDWAYVSPDRKALLIPVPEYTADRTDPCWVGYVAFPTERGQVVNVLLAGRSPSETTSPAACPTTPLPRPWYVRVPLSTPYRHQRVVDAATRITRAVRGTADPAPDRLADLEPPQ